MDCGSWGRLPLDAQKGLGPSQPVYKKQCSCACGPTVLRRIDRSADLGLDGRNRESVDTFPMCKPPLWVVSTPQNGPNAPLQAVLAHRVPV